MAIIRNKAGQDDNTIGEGIFEGLKEAIESVKNLKDCKGCARRRKKLKELANNLLGQGK